MPNSISTIPFHGDQIVVTDSQRIALKPVCVSLGLDFNGQLQRLKRTSWAGVCMTPTPSAGGLQEMATVDRRTFTMWLATIETGRLKNEAARTKIDLYQREAADALDAYFHNGGAINPRADEHQLNAIIFQSRAQMELCQAAKGLIHPDHLEARARIVLARGLGEKPEIDPGRRPLYAQDFLKEKNLSRSKLRSIAGVFGKRVKAAYILAHGRDPEQYDLDLSNGQVKRVNAYTEADRPLLDQVWDEHYETQEVLA